MKSHRVIMAPWRLLFFASLGILTHALELEMQSQLKCVYEEINNNVLVVGDYKSLSKDGHQPSPSVSVKVEDPHGAILHEATGKTEGQFAFTSKTPGEYKACFSVQDIQTAYQTKLKLDWRTGVAATDWNAIAKKEHLDALTVELRKLEDNIREVYSEMLQLQQREQEMRNISEETNSRVAWFSIASLGVCVASALVQLWYLRRFFKRKKLL